MKRFREAGSDTAEGDRILIMGEEVDGKTDDIPDIVVKLDDTMSACNRIEAGVFEARLLGPLTADNGEDEEELKKTIPRSSCASPSRAAASVISADS